jgi:CDP-diacylglycerol--glycerol-3-phosphate 3-phosphatidyltransferase
VNGSVVKRDFRERARAGIEPVVRPLGRLGLSPNVLTLIGFVIAVVAAGFAATQAWLEAGALVAFGAAFDLLDGALARAMNRLSRFGAFLDSTMDRAGEAVIYVGVASGCMQADFRAGAALAVLALAASFMVSYTRARSESLGFTSGRGMAKVGLAPREVRVGILVIGLLLTGLAGGVAVSFPFGDYAGQGWLLLTLGVIAILATITTVQRIVHVYLQAKKE